MLVLFACLKLWILQVILEFFRLLLHLDIRNHLIIKKGLSLHQIISDFETAPLHTLKIIFLSLFA